MARPTWTEITETAPQPGKSWNRSDILNFHYFNPNGLLAAKAVIERRVDILVTAGFLPSGWYYTAGSLNQYHADQIRKLSSKRRIARFDFEYAIKMMEHDNRENAKKVAWAEEQFLAGNEYDNDAVPRTDYSDWRL